MQEIYEFFTKPKPVDSGKLITDIKTTHSLKVIYNADCKRLYKHDFVHFVQTTGTQDGNPQDTPAQ